MRRVLKGLAASAIAVSLLSGCMSANYYTEQGTPITQDTIDPVSYTHLTLPTIYSV